MQKVEPMMFWLYFSIKSVRKKYHFIFIITVLIAGPYILIVDHGAHPVVHKLLTKLHCVLHFKINIYIFELVKLFISIITTLPKPIFWHGSEKLIFLKEFAHNQIKTIWNFPRLFEYRCWVVIKYDVYHHLLNTI